MPVVINEVNSLSVGASITSHLHKCVLFLLSLCLFTLSGVISPLISSSILGTYRPGEFIFQCPIILPFHTVHGVLKARILKWFAIPFSRDTPCPRSDAAAVRRYPTSKVRSSGCTLLEQP